MFSVLMGSIASVAAVALGMGAVVAVVWLAVKLLQGLFWLLTRTGRGIALAVRHVFRFVRDELVDALHTVGAVLTAGMITPLALLNGCIGRWSALAHYGRAIEDELTSAAVGVYRVALGNPARLLGLGILTQGVERRLPDLVARAPRPKRAAAKVGEFAGYKVLGTLPAGGSGAQLYLAKARPEKLRQLAAAGHPASEKFVIKSFALEAGSTLPQIVRESRALEAAGRLGLVLESSLTDARFHYVMPFVPGDDLNTVIARMHAGASDEGLSDRDLGLVTSYAIDLMHTLERFHDEGLWHKDIKPSNLIVSDGRIQLVDLGLVTPLASALTLTTHGTEFYRDPEMVRLALQGVKVHEVDGVKFDVYSAGAVLYSMIENDFPAQGNLSRITKRCPEALQWIVRRAMSDMDSRYPSARAMLADLRALMAARDPFALRPADLPSLGGAVRDEGPFARSRAGRASARPGGPAPLRHVASAAAGSGSSSLVRRRSAFRGLVAAGLWTLFVFGGVSTLVALGRGHHTSGRPAYVDARAGQVLDRAERRLQADLERELQRVQRISDQWARRLSELMPERARSMPPEARTAAAPTPERGTVLVLDGLGAGTDPGVLIGLRSSLEGAGYEVAGLELAEEPLQERTIRWIAGARKAAGLSDPGDGQAVLRLEDWLDGTRDLDAVFWIAPGGEEGQLLYRMVRKRDARVSAPERIAFEASPAAVARRN